MTTCEKISTRSKNIMVDALEEVRERRGRRRGGRGGTFVRQSSPSPPPQSSHVQQMDLFVRMIHLTLSRFVACRLECVGAERQIYCSEGNDDKTTTAQRGRRGRRQRGRRLRRFSGRELKKTVFGKSAKSVFFSSDATTVMMMTMTIMTRRPSTPPSAVIPLGWSAVYEGDVCVCIRTMSISDK